MAECMVEAYARQTESPRPRLEGEAQGGRVDKERPDEATFLIRDCIPIQRTNHGLFLY